MEKKTYRSIHNHREITKLISLIDYARLHYLEAHGFQVETEVFARLDELREHAVSLYDLCFENSGLPVED